MGSEKHRNREILTIWRGTFENDHIMQMFSCRVHFWLSNSKLAVLPKIPNLYTFLTPKLQNWENKNASYLHLHFFLFPSWSSAFLCEKSKGINYFFMLRTLPVLSKLWDRIFWIICFCLSEMYRYIWIYNPISSFISCAHQGIQHRWKESNLSLIFRKYCSETEIINFPYT